MMNIFRFAGDMMHVMSIVVLILRLRVSKNAIGISIKTQELYLVVFITRYLDLFTTYYSLIETLNLILLINLFLLLNRSTLSLTCCTLLTLDVARMLALH